MNHWYFIVPLAVLSYAAILFIGLQLGVYLHELRELVQDLNYRLRNVEAEEDDSSAVIETTPQTIETKRRKGQLPSHDDEDSAIVTVKSPKQLREERDAKLKAELDEIQGHSSRIE